MTPQQWYNTRQGQSILIPGGGNGNNGQCEQAVDDYIHIALGQPYVYTPAAMDFWNKFSQLGLNKNFSQVSRGQPILNGDLIVYDQRVGATQGHIDTAAGNGSISDFWAYDSNWGGKQFTNPETGYPILHEVHHNDAYNNYIIGYLRFKGGTQMDLWTNGRTYNLLFHAISPAVAEQAKAAGFNGWFGAQNGQEVGAAFDTIISSPQFDELVAANKGTGGFTPYGGVQLYTKN